MHTLIHTFNIIVHVQVKSTDLEFLVRGRSKQVSWHTHALCNEAHSGSAQLIMYRVWSYTALFSTLIVSLLFAVLLSVHLLTCCRRCPNLAFYLSQSRGNRTPGSRDATPVVTRHSALAVAQAKYCNSFQLTHTPRGTHAQSIASNGDTFNIIVHVQVKSTDLEFLVRGRSKQVSWHTHALCNEAHSGSAQLIMYRVWSYTALFSTLIVSLLFAVLLSVHLLTCCRRCPNLAFYLSQFSYTYI